MLDRGELDAEQMWGPRGGDTWVYNDALVNSDKLVGTPTYVSTGNGVWDEFDEPAEYTIQGSEDVMPWRTAGSLIEMATYGCGLALKTKMEQNGTDVDMVWNLRDSGTHEWDHWQADLHDSWHRMFANELY